MASTLKAAHPAAVVSLIPLLRTEAAAVRTVYYRDAPFAVVQAESALEARERAKRLLFCSCLNALDERQIEVRDADDAEFERWAKFRRDHVFECPTSLLGIPPLVPPTRRGERRRRSRRFLRQLAVFGAVLLLPILAAAGGIYAGFNVPADKYAGAADASAPPAGTIAVAGQSGQTGHGGAAAGDGTRSSAARRAGPPTPMGSAAAEIVERFTNRQFAAVPESFGLGRQPTLASQGSQRSGGATEGSAGNGEGGSPSNGTGAGGTSSGGSDGQGTVGAPSAMVIASTSAPSFSTSPTSSDIPPGETGTSPGVPVTPTPIGPTGTIPRPTTPGTEGPDTQSGGPKETEKTTQGGEEPGIGGPGGEEPGRTPTTTTEKPPTTEDPTLPDDETTPTSSPGNQPTVVAVPEPGSLALFGVSLAALALARRRRRAQSPR